MHNDHTDTTRYTTDSNAGAETDADAEHGAVNRAPRVLGDDVELADLGDVSPYDEDWADSGTPSHTQAEGSSGVERWIGWAEPDPGSDVLLALRDVEDRGRDGASRFAAQLARHADQFRTSTGVPTSDPIRYAAVAFQIGSPPVMRPPYIGAHPRVVRAYPLRDHRARRALVVELAIPTPRPLAAQLPVAHRGWETDAATGHRRPPTDLDQPIGYVRLTIGVPIRSELLPEPRYDDQGVPDLDTARSALRALTTHVSALCAHLVSSLNDASY